MSAALRFPLGHPAVACVVTGARNAAEVRQNVAWFDEPNDAAAWESLKSAGLLEARVPIPGDEE